MAEHAAQNNPAHQPLIKQPRVMTPAELSKMKYEKDQKELAEAARHREIMQQQYSQRLRVSTYKCMG